ncbi:hypothetical protein JAAARDRAFT_42311 [Jaapia argillacea MUCL 33604]|uniref:Monothiol glutaredoxin-5, mitochondrial n=1 Tax=Jaapia argillacea MUCL 33604 TaxID=933084 RepID=A0A067PGH8_9AGAM|nr:hypothetical protein JAAARDRAFT_42311 [Jaapia argillacea MUCL 33604]
MASMLRSAFRSSSALRLQASSVVTMSPTLALARRFISEQTRSAIQKAVDSSPVVVFMKGTPDVPQCGFSRAVIQILDLHNVPPEKLAAFNVLEDSELRNGIKEFSDWPTIPQVYVKGEFVGGCDIVLGMHQSGELETLLQNSDVISKPPTSDADSDASSTSTPASS